MSVITALTAQNTKSVTGIFPVEPTFVAEQIDAHIPYRFDSTEWKPKADGTRGTFRRPLNLDFEAAVENALEAMRIHGGYGYSKEYHIERYFRDAPLMCIGEGTNEIQRMIIAKQLIERNKI